MAKPKKPVKEQRTLMMGIPVNEAERELFRKVAEAHHTTFAEFVRQYLHREARLTKVA